MTKKNSEFYRIEICGGIASGKTTFSKLIDGLGLFPVNEDYNINPFLREFYRDPSFFSFETEMSFLLEHYHVIKNSQKTYNRIACDFSFVLDLAYADTTLNTVSEKRIFEKLLDEVYKQISPPNLVVYLKCSPDVLFNRIRRRGRKMEMGITHEYLSELTGALERRINGIDNKDLIIIESDKVDFINNKNQRNESLNQIKEKIL